MHLGRFHRVIYLLARDNKTYKITTLFESLLSNLSTYSASPSTATSIAFADSLEQLKVALSKAKSNNFVASQKAIVDQINGWKYCGNGLFNEIQEIVSTNNILPASALEKLQKLQTEYNKFNNSILSIDNAFTNLEVEYEQLEEDKGEFGISIPRSVAGDTLHAIEGEIKWINNLLSAFNELVGDGNDSPVVRNISSSDWQFFIEQSPIVIPLIVISIERIVALIKSNLEIKLLKKQLEDNNLPPNIISEIQKHVESEMKAGIRKIAEEVAKDYGEKVQEQRKNELMNQITFGLLKLAKRINEGADVEISFGLPEKPEEPAADSVDEVKKKYELDLKEFNLKREFAISINNRGLAVSNQIEDRMKDQPLLTDYESNEVNKEEKK